MPDFTGRVYDLDFIERLDLCQALIVDADGSTNIAVVTSNPRMQSILELAVLTSRNVEVQYEEGPPGKLTRVKFNLDVGAAIEAEVARQQETGASEVLEQLDEVMKICATDLVPAGWIKIDDHWNPTICGSPTSIVYNVWTIARYDNKPVGHVMTVCASAQTPAGWVEVNNHWNPTKCGRPTSIVNNMKTIRRVR